jgi:hypothetical protein
MQVCDLILHYVTFCVLPIPAQLVTSSVKNLSQQSIRAAGPTASVSLGQVSFAFTDSVSDFYRVEL